MEKTAKKSRFRFQTGAFTSWNVLKLDWKYLLRNLETFWNFTIAGFGMSVFSDQWNGSSIDASLCRAVTAKRESSRSYKSELVSLNPILRMCLLCQMSSDQAVGNANPENPSQIWKNWRAWYIYIRISTFPGAPISQTHFSKEKRSAQSLVLVLRKNMCKKTWITWVVIQKKPRFPYLYRMDWGQLRTREKPWGNTLCRWWWDSQVWWSVWIWSCRPFYCRKIDYTTE